MSYIALYRKWRPKTFDEVFGRESIIKILKNQIKNNKIAHAYLFCGTRGTGKTSIAKILSLAVNCEEPVNGSPCYKCESCKKLTHTNFDIVEIDAASNNGVDNIRDIISEVEYLPTIGKYKVYIIDEVHMLSTGAFNALLKTLEEPPAHVIFILATTEVNKLPLTILSRCQRYDFDKISAIVIAERLKDIISKENISMSDAALNYISEISDGAMRDALSLLEQCISYKDKLDLEDVLKILGRDSYIGYHSMFLAFIKQDLSSMMKAVAKLLAKGKNPENLVFEFSNYIKNVLVYSMSKEFFDNLSELEKNSVKKDSEFIDDNNLDYVRNAFTTLINLYNDIKKYENKKTLLEMSIIRILTPRGEEDNSTLIATIKNLEKEIDDLKYKMDNIGELKIVDSNLSEKIKPDGVEKFDLEESRAKVLELPDDVHAAIKVFKKYIENIKMEKRSSIAWNIIERNISINIKDNIGYIVIDISKSRDGVTLVDKQKIYDLIENKIEYNKDVLRFKVIENIYEEDINFDLKKNIDFHTIKVE